MTPHKQSKPSQPGCLAILIAVLSLMCLAFIVNPWFITAAIPLIGLGIAIGQHEVERKSNATSKAFDHAFISFGGSKPLLEVIPAVPLNTIFHAYAKS